MVNFVNIPKELKTNASFCLWKLEKRSGKPTKVPYNPRTGQLAKTNDPSSFGDFNTAMKAYVMGGWDGIGYRVSEGIGAIDIDHCIREDGSLNDVAASILAFLPDAYEEETLPSFEPDLSKVTLKLEEMQPHTNPRYQRDEIGIGYQFETEEKGYAEEKE